MVVQIRQEQVQDEIDIIQTACNQQVAVKETQISVVDIQLAELKDLYESKTGKERQVRRLHEGRGPTTASAQHGEA